QGVDVECFDEPARSQLTGALHAILQNLPPGAILQVCRWTDRDIADELERYRRSATGDAAFGQLLVDAKIRHAAAHPMLRRTVVYLVLSLSRRRSAADNPAKLRIRPVALTADEHAATLTRLRTILNHVWHGLAGAGVAVGPVSSTKLRNLVYRLLHPARS